MERSSARVVVYIPDGGEFFCQQFFGDAKERVVGDAHCYDRSARGTGAAEFDVATLLINGGVSVATGLISAALYDALKHGVTWIRIGGKKVDTDTKSIEKALNEELVGSGESDENK